MDEIITLLLQATVEKVLKCISEDNKDVRKGEWGNKEVSTRENVFSPILHFL